MLLMVPLGENFRPCSRRHGGAGRVNASDYFVYLLIRTLSSCHVLSVTARQ